jgi:predicted HAD superfamily phosphohydrolase
MSNHHKGRAVNILRKLFERELGPVTAIGVGDSLNDRLSPRRGPAGAGQARGWHP